MKFNKALIRQRAITARAIGPMSAKLGKIVAFMVPERESPKE
jgi:hypothetical protein